MKAIETRYAGHCFRSRLEARWAVFFNRLGIRWEYEPEGFEVGCWDEEFRGKQLYLPDFYLTDLGTWVEVKGSLSDLPSSYFQMIAECVDWRCGLPGTEDSFWTTRGLLWLGPIPKDDANAVMHAILQHQKGGYVNECYFTDSGGIEVESNIGYFDSSWGSQEKLRKAIALTVYEKQWQYPDIAMGRKVYAAYQAARMARFEHGVSGATR